MSNSLRNILLSEDTGEELKKKGYIKISDAKKDEYEKKGCKVVRSDNQTYYAKCQSSNDNNNQQVVVTLNCPPNEDIAPFQKWLNDNNKPWYQGGKFNGTLGSCGNATKQAWANNEWKNGYLSFKSSGTGGGNVSSQSTPLDSRGYNPDVVKFAKEITFFDDAGRSIKKFDASLNEDFDNDGEVNRALKIATNLVPNRNMSPYRAYIFAVNYVLLERGVNIGSIDVPKEYQQYLPQGTIIENLILKPLVGLINLLSEQDRVRLSIDIDDGTKKIGTVVKTRKTNIGRTCNLQNPLRFKADVPDEDPLIGMVKDKLNVGQEEDELEKNIFTAQLARAIIQHRTEKGLSFSRSKGDIDTELVRDLFDDCKPPTGGTPSGTGAQGFSLRNFGFREVLERANSILSEASSNVDLYFKDCQYIFDEYPRVARNADSTITALPQSRKPDLSKIDSSSELKNIKEAITYCATKRKGKTKVSIAVDKLNIFKRGIKSIMDLPSPWRMSEIEIFKGSQIGSENN